MQSSAAPVKIQVPFANGGSKNTIPVSSQIGITAGAASFTDGFPPLTRTPLAAGGVPPSGADMNGILNAVTAVQQWQSAGGMFAYDSAFSSAVGGYPLGAVLRSADSSQLWFNLVESNTSNPDSGGAGWLGLSSGRLLNVKTFQAGTYTYTPTAGTASIVVEVQAGGGAGGGAQATSSGQIAAGQGGSGGGYSSSRLTSGFSGVSITVGAGGSSNIGADGGNGGSSSFGAILSATGGFGGGVGAATATPSATFPVGGRNGGIGSGGNLVNATGGLGRYALVSANSISGDGGSSKFGAGAYYTSGTSGGNAAGSPGAGGSGATLPSGASGGASGGAGAGGLVIIWEYAK